MKSSQAHIFRLVQLSDCHILPEPENTLYSVNPRKNLEAVLKKIKLEGMPDAIVITGDLVQDGSAKSYLQLSEVISTINCPIYYIPGNHDDHEQMANAFASPNLQKNEFHLLWDSWQIILLDSTSPGLNEGFLATVDFEHLKKYLDLYPDHSTIIALHHPPVMINSPSFDSVGLINSQLFLNEIEPYSNIKVILFGHIHQLFETQKNNIQFLSSPSTAIQFNKNAKIDYSLTSGYRWLELKTNGQFNTGVVFL